MPHVPDISHAGSCPTVGATLEASAVGNLWIRARMRRRLNSVRRGGMIETLRFSVASPEAEKYRGCLVEANHAMHCLRMVRLHYRALETGTSWDWDVAHDYHCFDSLRQYIMCNPDYTLWYISGHRVNGYMQKKTCQDWDALRDWTEEHTSNYYDQYDMEPGTIGDNLWYNYHAGDGLPIGSL
ncbi:hypothetical protein EAE99_001739 [Botrytis elliptica]|nr:hypothetical protein EAE99_001739 [Botrytis elliptica]